MIKMTEHACRLQHARQETGYAQDVHPSDGDSDVRVGLQLLPVQRNTVDYNRLDDPRFYTYRKLQTKCRVPVGDQNTENISKVTLYEPKHK